MIGRSCSHRAACYIRSQIRFRPTEEFWKKRSAEIRILHFPKEIAVFFSKLIASGLQFLPIRSIKFWQDVLVQKPAVIQVHELILVTEISVKGPSACEAGHDYFARNAALRGHNVCLFEKSDKLGGNLIPAGNHAFKRDLHPFRRCGHFHRLQAC